MCSGRPSVFRPLTCSTNILYAGGHCFQGQRSEVRGQGYDGIHFDDV